MKKKTKSIKPRISVKCRVCFMVDSYDLNEKHCRHCRSQIFHIDAV